MDVNPYDWKRKLEEKKVQLMEEKVNIEKTKVGLNDELEDDGFIEALENAAKNLVIEEGLEEDE